MVILLSDKLHCWEQRPTANTFLVKPVKFCYVPTTGVRTSSASGRRGMRLRRCSGHCLVQFGPRGSWNSKKARRLRTPGQSPLRKQVSCELGVSAVPRSQPVQARIVPPVMVGQTAGAGRAGDRVGCRSGRGPPHKQTPAELDAEWWGRYGARGGAPPSMQMPLADAIRLAMLIANTPRDLKGREPPGSRVLDSERWCRSCRGSPAGCSGHHSSTIRT